MPLRPWVRWVLLPLLMMVGGASTSQPMEVDEEDPIKAWVGSIANPTTPDDYIPCPLTGTQLSQPYSLDQQDASTPFYKKQEKAMRAFYNNPPLNKAITTSSSKRGKATMQPLSSSTIDLRVRTLNELVGFCAKWLNLPATMEHALNPHIVAMYLGFHVAKGSSHATLTKIANQLKQAQLTFINQDYCPKMLPNPSPSFTSTLNDWYTNLGGKFSSMEKHHKAKLESTTLWMVWEATTSKWNTFLAKLKVSEGGVRVRCKWWERWVRNVPSHIRTQSSLHSHM